MFDGLLFFSDAAFISTEKYKDFNLNLEMAENEAAVVCKRALDEIFAKTGVTANQVDMIISFCTQYNYQDVIRDMYPLRDDCEVIHFGGMGCSTGVVGMDCANKLLRSRQSPGTCIVITHENITRGFYTGLQRDSMVPNAIFRVGACAMMFSTDPTLLDRAKYKVEKTVRTYQTDDISFWAMGYRLDNTDTGGIYLPKKDVLAKISQKALNKTITAVGKSVLPVGEKLKFAAKVAKNKVLGRKAKVVPDMFSGVDHMAIHPGGPAVIDGVCKGLQVNPLKTQENSINAYYYYGNTSSPGVLYAMAHTETVKGVRKGEKMLALGLGAGFESNAAVLKAVRNFDEVHQAWEHVLENEERSQEASKAFEKFLKQEPIHSLDRSMEQTLRSLKGVAEKVGRCPFDLVTYDSNSSQSESLTQPEDSIPSSDLVEVSEEKHTRLNTPIRVVDPGVIPVSDI